MRTMLRDLKEIRIKRKVLGLTQQDLATRSGLNRSTIAKIETGRLDPSYSKVRKIFEILDDLERQMARPGRFEGIMLEDIHATPVDCVSASQTIYDVWIRMVETSFSQFPVKSDGRIVGSISERAITGAIFDEVGDGVGEQPIGSIMEEPFPTLSVATPLSLVGSLIMHTGTVLTRKDSDVVGIVTKSDVGKVLELLKV